MPESHKRAVIEQLHQRIRAHLRASMEANALGLVETAHLLREDKGALSAYLKDRAPSAYLIARILEVFAFNDPMDLFRKDPDARFFRPGPPPVADRPYAVKQRSEPMGNEDPPPPPKRRHATGHHRP